VVIHPINLPLPSPKGDIKIPDVAELSTTIVDDLLLAHRRCATFFPLGRKLYFSYPPQEGVQGEEMTLDDTIIFKCLLSPI
jgi:hypothetical protein